MNIPRTKRLESIHHLKWNQIIMLIETWWSRGRIWGLQTDKRHIWSGRKWSLPSRTKSAAALSLPKREWKVHAKQESATKNVLFSLLIHNHNLWSCQKVCLIIFLLDLELNFIGKLLVFQWELIVLLLLQICFFFVMREISWSLSHLSHLKIRLTLLRLSIQLQDTLMIYWILKIFTLTKWWTRYILQNSN